MYHPKMDVVSNGTAILQGKNQVEVSKLPCNIDTIDKANINPVTEVTPVETARPTKTLVIICDFFSVCS